VTVVVQFVFGRPLAPIGPRGLPASYRLSDRMQLLVYRIVEREAKEV
jgi:hypothetical protein